MNIKVPILCMMMILCGCSTFTKVEDSEKLPLLPGSIHQFLEQPQDGKFSFSLLEDTYNCRYGTLVCEKGKVYLTQSINGALKKKPLDRIVYRKELPTNDFFESLKHPVTEDEIHSKLGDSICFGMEKNILTGLEKFIFTEQHYRFFTVNRQSEVIIMEILVHYEQSDNGEFLVDKIDWHTNSQRKIF